MAAFSDVDYPAIWQELRAIISDLQAVSRLPSAGNLYDPRTGIIEGWLRAGEARRAYELAQSVTWDSLARGYVALEFVALVCTAAGELVIGEQASKAAAEALTKLDQGWQR